MYTILCKFFESIKISQDTSNASFFVGGVSSSLLFESGGSSALRFSPALESGEGDNGLINENGGGVCRGTSGVADLLWPPSSLRSRAAKVVVECNASEWQVAWYIYT